MAQAKNSPNKPSEKVDSKPTPKIVSRSESAQENAEKPVVGPEPTEKEVAAQEKADDKAEDVTLAESSKKAAKDDDYDPDSDPVVPDSALAEVIRAELHSGASPTLDALRSAAKDAKAAEK